MEALLVLPAAITLVGATLAQTLTCQSMVDIEDVQHHHNLKATTNIA